MSKEFKNVTTYSKAIHNTDHPYLMISQTILQDKNLDLLEKGIMAELLNHDETYIINTSYLQKISGIGEDRFYKKIKHLISLGYISKKRIQSGVSWTIIESPLDISNNGINGENTNCENTNSESTSNENTNCENTNSESTISENTNCGNTGILITDEPIIDKINIEEVRIDEPYNDELKNDESNNDKPEIYDIVSKSQDSDSELGLTEEKPLDQDLGKDIESKSVDQNSNSNFNNDTSNSDSQCTSKAKDNELQRLLNKTSQIKFEDYQNRDRSPLEIFHYQIYRNNPEWSDRQKYDISQATSGGIAYEVFEYKKLNKTKQDSEKQREMIKANPKLTFMCYSVNFFQKFFPKSEIWKNYKHYCQEANRQDLID